MVWVDFLAAGFNKEELPGGESQENYLRHLTGKYKLPKWKGNQHFEQGCINRAQ